MGSSGVVSERSIINERLHNEGLVGKLDDSPEDVVAALGAVQAQDFAVAKWAVGQRTTRATDAEITRLFNEGKILRTHVLRPTWHFVAPTDIRWLLALTAPRVHAANAYYYRKLELHEDVLRKSQDVIAHALAGGKQLMRTELAQILENAGIVASGLRLVYVIMSAELNGIVCSGALRGKQHTYALLEERVAPTPDISREEALARLARIYFTSHGPAMLADFAWWSGLTAAEAKTAASLSPTLTHYVEDGKEYWSGKTQPQSALGATAHLLPNYDEYMIAYKDRSAFFDPAHFEIIPTSGFFDRHVIVMNGTVAGAWRAETRVKEVLVHASLLITPTAAQRVALQRAAERYGAFVELPVTLVEHAKDIHLDR